MTPIELSVPDALVEAIADRISDRLAHDRQPSQWLTVRNAAAHLGLSANAIRALVKRSRIPFYRVEGRILLEQNELDRWVRSGGLET